MHSFKRQNKQFRKCRSPRINSSHSDSAYQCFLIALLLHLAILLMWSCTACMSRKISLGDSTECEYRTAASWLLSGSATQHPTVTQSSNARLCHHAHPSARSSANQYPTNEAGEHAATFVQRVLECWPSLAIAQLSTESSVSRGHVRAGFSRRSVPAKKLSFFLFVAA
jgi:hypothetical protein